MIEKKYPNRDAWLKGRGNALSATDSAKYLGLNPYESRASLKKEKLGQKKKGDLRKNAAVAMGIDFEWYVAHRFERQTGLPIHDPGPFTVQIHAVHEWLTATCDRYLFDQPKWYNLDPGKAIEAPVELKTGLERMWNPAPPAYYICQLQHQMLVTGCETGYLAVLLIEPELRERYWDIAPADLMKELVCNTELREWVFEKDPVLQARIIDEGLAFKEELEAEGWGKKGKAAK